MGIKGRQAAVFACGIALGAAAAAWFVMDRGGAENVAAAPATAAHPAGPVALAAVELPESTRCEFEPVIKAAQEDDGTRRLPADLAHHQLEKVGGMLVAGKENAAAGRLRDAEVAFLGACRIGRALGDAGFAAYADAKYQLGRHYAVVARTAETSAAEQAELLQRARLLYGDALAALRARHGGTHEKTRFATEGLARVEQAFMGASGAPGAEPGMAPAARLAPAAAGAAQVQ